MKNVLRKRSVGMALLTSILLATSCSIKMLEDKSHTPVATQPTEQASTIVESEPEFNFKPKENTPAVQKYCQKIDSYFAKYNWGKSGCDDFTWHHVRNSHLGNPIIWYVFGNVESKNDVATSNTTLILCGVHGDEITPIKFCFDIMNDLKSNPQLFNGKQVVVAPIVAPDSFFTPKPSRTNARGVDVNRNFPTKDWSEKAIKIWKESYRSDPRRNPGPYAMSEQETLFQVNLINLYRPNKVVSVHAPLTMLDYDGPDFTTGIGSSAKDLLISMSHLAGQYKISNYPFFPGSLGNWAGNERDIPTYTLELPNSDWNKTDKYFQMFKTAIHQAIEHKVVPDQSKKKLTQHHHHE